MLTYPLVDPVLFAYGPLVIRWYGLMYLFGFVAAYLLVKRQAQTFQWNPMLQHLDNLNLCLIFGLILGARLGYVVFYNLPYYIEHPGEILATWQGGMSFHGGLLGLLLVGWIYCRSTGLEFWKAADAYTVTAPLGIFFGRFGNFINGELYGRTTDSAWGIVFPEGGPLPRHPSQLYEAVLEGLVLFIILWSLKARPWAKNSTWPHGSMVALFLIFYGIFRYFVEFYREPDAHLGLVFLWMTLGQVLCAAMVLAGSILALVLRKQQRVQTQP
jgi:phosphatidylglycerol---prolipoprotein diacylglyceryl transferase